MKGRKSIMEKTLDSRLSSAELCRQNNWKVGTLLAGDEGYGISVIKITAIGENDILARLISHKGIPENGYETSWTLDCREWEEVKI